MDINYINYYWILMNYKNKTHKTEILNRKFSKIGAYSKLGI